MEPILVALIAASSSIIVALIHKVRVENRHDHHANGHRLDRIARKIDNVHERVAVVQDRLDHHIDHHGSNQ